MHSTIKFKAKIQRVFPKELLCNNFRFLFLLIVEALELKSKKLSEVESIKEDAVTNYVSLQNVHYNWWLAGHEFYVIVIFLLEINIKLMV